MHEIRDFFSATPHFLCVHALGSFASMGRFNISDYARFSCIHGERAKKRGIRIHWLLRCAIIKPSEAILRSRVDNIPSIYIEPILTGNLINKMNTRINHIIGFWCKTTARRTHERGK